VKALRECKRGILEGAFPRRYKRNTMGKKRMRRKRMGIILVHTVNVNDRCMLRHRVTTRSRQHREMGCRSVELSARQTLLPDAGALPKRADGSGWRRRLGRAPNVECREKVTWRHSRRAFFRDPPVGCPAMAGAVLLPSGGRAIALLKLACADPARQTPRGPCPLPTSLNASLGRPHVPHPTLHG
jgi:hypothetical protein